MDRLPNGNSGEMGDSQQNQQMYYSGSSQDPRMAQYSQQMMTQGGALQQVYSPDQQMSAATPEMHNGSPQVAQQPQQQQLTLEQQQQLAQRQQAMMQRQYSSPALTGRGAPLNGNDQRSKSSQNLIGGVQQQRPQEGGLPAMNGMSTVGSQMPMSQAGFMSPTYSQQASNGQQTLRQQTPQQLAHLQQLQQAQYQQQLQLQQQQQQGTNQQMSMSMQINSQMTQMNIQVGSQSTAQQQQVMMQQQPQQYTQQQLQQIQQLQQQGHPQQMLAGQQSLQQGQMTNGQYATYQMNMTQMGQQGSSQMMSQQHMQMTEQQLQLDQQARLQMQQQQLRRQHPHLSAQPRSASMGSLPLNQQQPPQYQYPQGQHPGMGPRPNGMNPFTVNGTPVSTNWTMCYQTEMPPAFLNCYLPGKPNPYFDHPRRALPFPYPMGTKDVGDSPEEPSTFGFLPDSIYYNPANDRRGGKGGCGNDQNLGGPSTSKASPKKRGAGTAGGGGGAKKQRRTNSDATDDARFAQPYPPNMAALPQQRMPSTSTAMYPATQSFEGFSQQPGLPMQQAQTMIQQQQPHMQLQRQMSAPAYSGLAQSAQDAMQNARQAQAIANAQAQYAAQQQQQPQVPSTSTQMPIDGYQSPTGDGMYEMQWRAAYAQQPVQTSSAPSSQPVFRSPPPQQQQQPQQSFNNGASQPQQSQQPGSNDQMYWGQQQQQQ